MIKTLAVTFLLATSWNSAAFADQFKVNSTIDRVTVYPQGADVERLGSMTFNAGEHELVFEGLPASLDPQSLRIDGLSGEDVQITSVDYEVKPVDDAARAAQALAYEKQLEALNQERQRVARQIEDVTQQRQLLLQLAQRPLVPVKADEAVGTDSKILGEVLSLVGTQLKETSDVLHTANLSIIDIDKQIAEINEKQHSAGPEAEQTATVTIHVVATRPSQADLKLQYRIHEAHWSPYYDAKLIIPKTGSTTDIELVRRAEVTQSSTESWDNVALTLSTARPNGSTSAPDLDEELLSIHVEGDQRGGASLQAAPESAALLEDKQENDASLSKQKDGPRKIALNQQQAQLSEVGFQVNYDVQGRVSVSNAGKAKKVRVSSEVISAALSVFTTPRLDAAAYLNADFKLNEKSTLLPGPVSLYRDGTYVGQNYLPLLVAGEELNLGFGVDDLVRVTRKEVKRTADEEGLISISHTEDRAWKIDIQNLHDRAMKITVLDRMPVSTRDDVTVAPLFEQTPPTTTSYKDRRGVLAWTFDLDSKAEKSLNTGYRVTWPEAIKVSVVD